MTERASGSGADEGGNDYIDFFGGLVKSGTDAYVANRNAKNRQPVAQAQATTPKMDLTKYTKPALFVVAGLIVLLIVKKIFKF
jgi:hypothetical protein